MTDTVDNPYSPPHASVLDPPREDPPEHWPLLMKVLVGFLIAECVVHVFKPSLSAGGLAWPDFGNLLTTVMVLFSVFERNRWGWILGLILPVTIMPFVLFQLVAKFDSKLLDALFDLDSPAKFMLLGIPGTVTLVLRFFPTTIRWYFGKHARRTRYGTAAIVGMFLLSIVASGYGSYRAAADEIEERQRRAEQQAEQMARQLDELGKLAQESQEETEQELEELTGERVSP